MSTLKGTMRIEITGHDFKENPNRTTLKLGPIKLPEGVEAKGDLIYVGEDDTHLHCFVSTTGAYVGLIKTVEENHLYQRLLRLNTINEE